MVLKIINCLLACSFTTQKHHYQALVFMYTYAAGINSSITQHAFSYIVCLQLPSAPYFEYKTSGEDTRPTSLVDKDGEDAIAPSGNNGDRLMEKQKPKCGVFLLVNLVT